MSISDHTRKLLWARSGSLCAWCRRELVLPETAIERASIIGEECHIHASNLNGPRYDSNLESGEVDSYENLILLCSVHHKLVDDQWDTYNAESLKKLKREHEGWIRSKLKEERSDPPIKILSLTNEILSKLRRVSTGKEVLSIVTFAGSYSFDYEQQTSSKSMELIAEFFQIAEDYGEISDILTTADRVQAAINIQDSLDSLQANGLLVFGGRERQVLTGGKLAPQDWYCAHLFVASSESPNIGFSDTPTSPEGG